MVKKPAREHADANMTTRVLVQDIMNSPVISASPKDTLVALAKKMTDQKIGSIIVIDSGGKPVGIVTDWDIVSRGIALDAKPSTLKAEQVMQPLHTIEGSESVTEAARLLRKHNIKRLGVINKNRLVGIISSSDVIAVTPELVDVVSEKAAIFKGELGIGKRSGKISGSCDECGEWSDFLEFDEGKFVCEVCRGEAQTSDEDEAAA